MGRVRGVVRSILAHTRYVPTPLYRLMVLGWLVSALIQWAQGEVNVSIRDGGPGGWWDWLFLGVQTAGAVTVLVGLYLVEENTHHASKLNRSLTLELIGLIELQTAVAWQIAGATMNQGGPPSAGSTWMAIIFSVWGLFRMRDIVRAQRQLGSKS